MSLKFDLDNCFSRYGLGCVYFKKPDFHHFWPSYGFDYVGIGVPKSLEHRFAKFWESVKAKLGEGLNVYHVHKGVPLSKKYILDETLYFISVESAMRILYNFSELLPADLKDYYC
jgi:hypothetical protein